MTVNPMDGNSSWYSIVGDSISDSRAWFREQMTFKDEKRPTNLNSNSPTEEELLKGTEHDDLTVFDVPKAAIILDSESICYPSAIEFFNARGYLPSQCSLLEGPNASPFGNSTFNSKSPEPNAYSYDNTLLTTGISVLTVSGSAYLISDGIGKAYDAQSLLERVKGLGEVVLGFGVLAAGITFVK